MAIAVVSTQREQFFENLARASGSALLLDYDGTLAPFRVERCSAVPYAGSTDLVKSIIKTKHTRVVFISGRPAMELEALLPISPAPEIWGSHGLERITTDGAYQIAEVPLESLELLTVIDLGLAAEGLRPLMEVKPGAIAVHWRDLSRSLMQDIRQRVARVWVGVQPQDRLDLGEFEGGIEIRLRKPNKGDAVRQILEEMGKGALVAYLGDDLTDEDAFRALKNQGLSVLVKDAYRETEADVWVRPPEGVLEFLGEWLTVCGGVSQ